MGRGCCQDCAPAEGRLREYQLFQLGILKEFKRVCDEHGLTWWIAYGTLIGAARHQGFIPWDDDVDVVMPAEDYLRFREVAPSTLGEGFYFQSHGTNPCNFIEWQRIGVSSSTSMPCEYAGIHAEWGICIDIFPLFPAPAEETPGRKEVELLKATVSRLSSKYLYRHWARSGGSLIRRLYYGVMGSMPDCLNAWMWKRAERILMTKYAFEAQAYGSFDDSLFYPVDLFCGTVMLSFEGMELPAPVGYEEFLDRFYGPDWRELPPVEERIWHSGGGSDEVLVSLTEPYEKFLK